MARWFFLLFLSLIGVSRAEDLDSYLEYISKYPNTMGPFADARKGEIEIILDQKKISEIEEKTGRKIGIVAEDRLWIWMNDAVLFPNGRMGFFPRIVFKTSLEKAAGVAVLPLYSDGKIIVNRIFRHATRSWEYEIPRGGVEALETVEEAARREVLEETGKVVDELISLGRMNPDSGITNLTVPLFLARVIDEKEPQRTETEAIAGIETLSLEECRKLMIDGFRIVLVDKTPCCVYMRDPFLAFALLQAVFRGIILFPSFEK